MPNEQLALNKLNLKTTNFALGKNKLHNNFIHIHKSNINKRATPLALP